MDAVRDCIHTHMETVLNIEKTLQFIAALPAEDTEARKIDRQLEKLKTDYEQAMRFKMSAYTNVRTLTRELVDLLIQNIYIYSSTSIEIVWKCGDEYQRLLADTAKKEAVEHEG